MMSAFTAMNEQYLKKVDNQPAELIVELKAKRVKGDTFAAPGLEKRALELRRQIGGGK